MPNQDLKSFLDQLSKQSELTSAEIEVQEKYFRSEIYSTSNAGEARAKLKEFFFTEPKDTIEKSKRFWYSYWRWYTMLNWAGFIGLSEADMLFSMAYQAPMAVALDYNPADELRRYLALNCLYEDDMVEMYSRVKPSFLASEAYLGMWQGKEVFSPEIIKELTDVGFEEDSLQQAEFQSKLSQILFPDNELVEKYFFATSDVAVKKFISLAIFLQTVDEKEIWLAVDSFIYPEKYKDKVLAELSSATKPVSISAPPATPAKPISVVLSPPPSTPAKPAAPAQPVVVKPVASTKPTPQQVKSQIESQFKKDTDGNFEDIEGVMAKLSDLAEKNNDPKIADMIYFDETENKFKWNI